MFGHRYFGARYYGPRYFGGSGAVVVSYRATILVNGIITKIKTADLGTGKKAVVYVSNRWRQRQAAEGTPIIFDPATNRLRLLQVSETLEI